MKKFLILLFITISNLVFGAAEFDRLAITESATIPIIRGNINMPDSVTIGGSLTLTGISTSSTSQSTYLSLVGGALYNAPPQLTTNISNPQTGDVFYYSGSAWTNNSTITASVAENSSSMVTLTASVNNLDTSVSDHESRISQNETDIIALDASASLHDSEIATIDASFSNYFLLDGSQEVTGDSTFQQHLFVEKDLAVTETASIGGLIQIGTIDVYNRMQIWNSAYDSILRMGSAYADGDGVDNNHTSDGIIVYGGNVDGTFDSSNLGYSRIKHNRFGLYSKDSVDYTGYIFRVDSTELYFKDNDGNETFHIDRQTGDLTVGGTSYFTDDSEFNADITINASLTLPNIQTASAQSNYLTLVNNEVIQAPVTIPSLLGDIGGANGLTVLNGADTINSDATITLSASLGQISDVTGIGASITDGYILKYDDDVGGWTASVDLTGATVDGEIGFDPSGIFSMSPYINILGQDATFSMTAASATSTGYLTATDWNTFNSKIDAVSMTATQAVRYDTWAGAGTTGWTKIPYYTNQRQSVGSGIFTVANNNTNGFTITMTATAFCNFHLSASEDSAGNAVILTVDTSDGTAAPSSVPADETLEWCDTANYADAACALGATGEFYTNQQIRPQFEENTGGVAARHFFSAMCWR